MSRRTSTLGGEWWAAECSPASPSLASHGKEHKAPGSEQAPGSERIRIAMERQLAETLGRLYQRGKGATLHVVVKGVWLSSFAGGSGRSTGGGGSNDNFDSEITVLGPRGEVLQAFPILSVVDSGSGGAWYRPDVDQRRVAALIENNSLWIKRYLGG